MYDVDARDRVLPLEDVPQSSVGAPLPVVVADENSVRLAYYTSVPDSEWDGAYVREVNLSTEDPVILVQFEGAHAWFMDRRATKPSRVIRSRIAA